MDLLRIRDNDGDTLMIKKDGKGAIISIKQKANACSVYMSNEQLLELTEFLKPNNQ